MYFLKIFATWWKKINATYFFKIFATSWKNLCYVFLENFATIIIVVPPPPRSRPCAFPRPSARPCCPRHPPPPPPSQSSLVPPRVRHFPEVGWRVEPLGFIISIQFKAFEPGLMGWDGINCGYWCRHRPRDCSEAHRFPSEAFRQFGQQGYSKEKSPPQPYANRQVHTDRSDPKLNTYWYILIHTKYIQIFEMPPDSHNQLR